MLDGDGFVVGSSLTTEHVYTQMTVQEDPVDYEEDLVTPLLPDTIPIKTQESYPIQKVLICVVPVALIVIILVYVVRGFL
jgi:hypothetical protein